jgi:hypothetical protein
MRTRYKDETIDEYCERLAEGQAHEQYVKPASNWTTSDRVWLGIITVVVIAFLWMLLQYLTGAATLDMSGVTGYTRLGN